VAGPLAGVRVLDVTSVVLGPWAAQMLGDLGADIVKIEPPEGDMTRQLGPGRHRGMAAFYMGCNRNKRSLVLDLKQAAGRDALLRLASTADVLLHNFRPAPAARLGIGYEAFQAVNPRLVYCATYGFRATGPYGNKPAYDDIIQAAAGLASLQQIVAGEPRYVPTIVGDKNSSLTVVAAILSALFNRERTGEGQALEVPMFESLVAYVMVEHLYGETFVPAIETAGYKRILNGARRPFRTSDGYLAVMPYTDADWRAFFAIAGCPDLAADPRFATMSSRVTHAEVLYEAVGKVMPTRTSAEWLAALEAANVPVMVVNTLETLLSDAQLEATGFWKVIEHPTEGTLRLPDIPITYSRTPGAIRRLQPRLGEHSVEVLREAGFSQTEIDQMIASGVTSTAPAARRRTQA
jgi:crotonobetainyl-CoA:carnitine CoA-transferase CaiB-like acyl-CoA transferase